MQLNFFDHGRDVMLRNDVLQALDRHDGPAARSAWRVLQQEYPEDDSLARLPVLLDATLALLDTTQEGGQQAAPFISHQALQQARFALQQQLAPAAQSLMDAPAATRWLCPFWQQLVQRAAHLPFRTDCEADHAVALLLHIKDWQGALDAVAGIESWRRIPAPLAWMTQAKLNLFGLRATWALLAELAWLSPRRLAALVQSSPDPGLPRLAEQFEASFEEALPQAGVLADAGAGAELAWFPAWLLTAQPQLAPHLAQAQAGQHSTPEQAMRLLVNLLGLEHQGRHHDIVRLRKSLRDLHPGLYAAYLKTR